MKGHRSLHCPHYCLYAEDIPHSLCGFLLCRGGNVSVGVQCKPRGEVTQHAGYRLDIHPILQGDGRECVPKLVEAENRVLLVVAESRICYNADRLWFFRI